MSTQGNQKPSGLSASRNRMKVVWAGVGGLAGMISLCGLALAIFQAISPKSLSEVFQKEEQLRVEVFRDYAPAGGFAIYVDEPPPKYIYSSAAGNMLMISAVNLSKEEYASLDNSIPFRLTDYRSLQDTVNIQAIMPVAGFFRNYAVMLSSNDPEPKATYDVVGLGEDSTFLPGGEDLQLPSNPDPNQVPDYFSLEPGEREVFAIDVQFNAPGVYSFQAGIGYFMGGGNSVAWADQVFEAFVPAQIDEWSVLRDDPSGEMKLVKRCLFPFGAEQCAVLCSYMPYGSCVEELVP